MDDSSIGIEELAKFALLVFVTGLGCNLADLFDDLLFAVVLGLQNERKVDGRLIGALADLQRHLIVFLGGSPEFVEAHVGFVIRCQYYW